mgnify:FL=1|tara:strand:- start:252 stop:593 length:342 start_codon:yes stop_codon:yes gene_type:complete
MIKLKNILSEVLNTFQVEADIISDKKVGITSILDQIRGLYKVTIVNNVTPEEFPQKEKIEFTRVKIKFVTRTDPKQDIIQFRKDMLTSDMSKTDLRIPGVKSVKFKPETIKRI